MALKFSQVRIKRVMNKFVTAIAAILLLAGCGGKNTESNVDAPGEEKSGESKLLNTGAELLQDKSPLKAFSAYLDGFHFYNGNINAQMEAHHYVDVDLNGVTADEVAVLVAGD